VLSIVRSFARKVGYARVVRDRQFATPRSVVPCTHARRYAAMMMKTNKTNNGRSFARFALGAIAVLALAGRAHAVASTCAGAPPATYLNAEDNPATTVGPGANTCKCMTGYADTNDGVNTVGNTALDCGRCARGYFISTIGTIGASPSYSDGVCTETSPGDYWIGTGLLSDAATAVEVPHTCPSNTNSTAGSASVSACVLNTGYYLSVAGTTGNPGTVSQVPAGSYLVTGAGAAVDFLTQGTIAACPFAGSSSAGATSISACTPSCGTGTNAVAASGTCQCAANYYGTPVDTNGATVAAASTGCTACPAGTTSTAGTTASSGCTGASPTGASPTAASPTAASPTADSAGASTPIAVALAAAAAVPLLL
jgi:hypothetical protein